ncbi:AI-2E family transporter [Longibacter salinarum]|uniref:AI-2E family transporter n=1 Tax=Longibacter salinarum TaxID=1850348 RepID=A0A2A8CWF9_9BACT|nr:AI-2E family transporter [Longibacter salinarum]PEN12728.1 AI-2E family transporter [Longibacter salinarum]
MDTHLHPYTRRVLIAAAILLALVISVLLLRQIASVLLLFFAGILAGVFLDGLTSKLHDYSGIPRAWCLGIVVTLLLGFFVASVWYAGPRIDGQIDQLGERIPAALDRLRSSIEQYEWSRRLLSGSPNSGQAMSFVAGGVSSIVGGLTSVMVALIIGLYSAVNPDVYIKGGIRLLPKARRERGRAVVHSLGQALRWWLVGRIASMGVVGVLTAIGLWIAGIPLAIVLGLIAALLSFVPYIGPILSVIPAGLVAFAESPTKVVYVVILFAAVQFLESYVITPLIQERAVSLPPAVLIGFQVLMGIVAGALGVFMATPLAVAVIVLVQMLYIEDVLGEPVRTLGE